MKKFYTYILIITLCFSSIGCSKEEKKENENNNKAVVEEKDEKEINSGVSEEKKIDYSAYAGHWVNEKLLIQDFKYGTTVDLDVDEKGYVNGSVYSATENLAHIAQVDINGQIENNKLSYDFDEDGWEHSGNIEIEFKENSIVLNIKYNEKSSENNLWGIGEGAFPLINDTTPVKRTLNDIKDGGFVVQENQSFDTKIDNYGDIKFISGLKREDGNDIAVFYIADRNNNILYKLPAFYGNNKGRFEEVNCVAFMDFNGDNLKDILIIGKFLSNEDFSKEIHVASIYFQEGKEFKNNESLDNEINNSGHNENMESVVEFMKNS